MPTRSWICRYSIANDGSSDIFCAKVNRVPHTSMQLIIEMQGNAPNKMHSRHVHANVNMPTQQLTKEKNTIITNWEALMV